MILAQRKVVKANDGNYLPSDFQMLAVIEDKANVVMAIGD